MKKHIGYNLLIALGAALTLLFLVLMLLSLVDGGTDERLKVRESFIASSSLIESGDDRRQVQVQGSLINLEDQTLSIEELHVRIGNRETDRVFSWTDITLPSRMEVPLLYEWEDTVDYDRVLSVTVVIDGEELTLANHTADAPFNASALIYAALTLLSGWGLLSASKQRYYLAQADRMQQSEA